MTEKMKPSGIAWIGDIPQDWKCKRYRFCGNVQYGYPFNSDYFSSEETGFPLIRIRDITSGEIATYYEGTYPSEYVVQSGDVLIGMDGDFNVRIWKNRDALLNQRCCRVFDSQQISKRFMAYYLPHYLKVINDLTWSTTVKHLLADDINNIYVSYPGMREQQAIADFLDTRCAKIDSVIVDIEKQIETLQKYKKSLITETVTKGLNRSVPMKDSRVDWIGEIPSAWEAKRMKYFLSVASGDAITNDQLEDGDYPVFGGGKQMGWSNKHNIPGDTILIGRVGANCGCVSITPKESWATDNALIVSTNSYVKYVYYILVAADLNKLNDANAQPLITGAKVGNCVVPYTYKYEEQKLIADYLDSACSKIDEVLALKQQQLAKMQQHKKSLIYEYVTGKKRVTEVS